MDKKGLARSLILFSAVTMAEKAPLLTKAAHDSCHKVNCHH